jgi:hypothetical protein
MPTDPTAHGDATPEDAAGRLVDAEEMLDVAAALIDKDDRYACSSVAAAVAILAGLVAADAACSAKLGLRPPIGDPLETVTRLETVDPHGPDMAANLVRLLSRRGESHYGAEHVSMPDASEMTEWAKEMVVSCRKVLAS